MKKLKKNDAILLFWRKYGIFKVCFLQGDQKEFKKIIEKSVKNQIFYFVWFFLTLNLISWKEYKVIINAKFEEKYFLKWGLF